MVAHRSRGPSIARRAIGRRGVARTASGGRAGQRPAPRSARTRADASVTEPADTAVSRAFVEESRRRLRVEYMPKIRLAVSTLAPSDLWWRPNAHSNAVGNLLLHLEGNLRQWILCGLGGRADRRDRDAEFAARRGLAARVLVARLGRAVREADGVLANLTIGQLLATRVIQGYRVTGLRAVYHVVEHFSGHTGQILYIAKLRHDVDLGLYPHLWPRARRKTRSRHL